MDLLDGVSGLDELLKNISDIERKQIPFATALALNNTAKIVHESEVDLMKKVFDRPTPFILKSLRVVRANKNKQEAFVGFKDVFGRFGGAVDETLLPHVNGGRRKAKASELTLRRKGILRADEYIVPSRALKLNKFGNITPGLMNKILSNIGAQSDASANTQADKRSLRFVVGEVGGTRGIWSIQARRWKPVLIFVKAPNYKKRFDFHGKANQVMSREYESEFRKSFRFASSTAK